jgi:hypothetical protein
VHATEKTTLAFSQLFEVVSGNINIASLGR